MTIEPSQAVTRAIGAGAVIVSLATWGMDLFGIVGPCGYCRAQRSVIGILGIIALLPTVSHWFMQYVSRVLAAFGVVVAATQHFNAWNDISKGKFVFQWRLYENSFLLSGAALFIIVGLILVIAAIAHPQAARP